MGCLGHVKCRAWEPVRQGHRWQARKSQSENVYITSNGRKNRKKKKVEGRRRQKCKLPVPPGSRNPLSHLYRYSHTQAIRIKTYVTTKQAKDTGEMDRGREGRRGNEMECPS